MLKYVNILAEQQYFLCCYVQAISIYIIYILTDD